MTGIKRALAVLVIGGLALLLFRNWTDTPPGWIQPGQLQVAWQQDQSWTVGALELRWLAGSGHLELHHNQSVVWSSRPGQPWLTVARVEGAYAADDLAERIARMDVDHCDSQNWFDVAVSADGITLSGRIDCAQQSLPIAFRISSPGVDEVSFDWQLGNTGGTTGTQDSTDQVPAGWVVALDQPVSEQLHSFGLGPLGEEWRLDNSRYVVASEPGADRRTFFTMNSRFQAWALPPGALAVLDRRQSGISRAEFWRQPSETGGVDDGITLLSAHSPAALVRRVQAEGRPSLASIDAGADGLQSHVRWRIALGLSGVATNNQTLEPAPWLPPAPSTPGERVDWLAWLGLAALAAPEWPLEEDPVSPSGVLNVHADRLAELHRVMAPYRARWQVAAEAGAPVLRPLWFEFPEEAGAWTAGVDQFMLGSDILVVVPGATGSDLNVYLPPGVWTDLWTGIEWRSEGRYYTLTSAPDEPPALLRGSTREHGYLMNAAAELSTTRILRGGARFSSTDAPLRLE